MAKILIIDDERGIRNTLREVLADEGYEVEVAENGKQGLEMAQAKSYDLIYSDIKMPEMDGLEVLSKISEFRAQNSDSFESIECPIVMISGHGDNTHHHEECLGDQEPQTRNQTAPQESSNQRSADDRRVGCYPTRTRYNR